MRLPPALLLLALVLPACEDRGTPAAAPSAAPERALAVRPLSAHGGGSSAPSVGRGEGGITGTIDVDPRYKDRVKGGVLFLIARSAETHEILAVRKEQGVVFPFAFHISGADAMVEGTSFKGTLDITARLSRSGEAMPGPGDIEGVLRGVSSSAQGVALTLDTLRS